MGTTGAASSVLVLLLPWVQRRVRVLGADVAPLRGCAWGLIPRLRGSANRAGPRSATLWPGSGVQESGILHGDDTFASDDEVVVELDVE